MRTIYKYVFTGSVLTARMPAASKIIHIGLDPETESPAIWALVNTEYEFRERAFVIRGTGMKLEPDFEYIGTVRSGSLIWHAFEVIV